MIISSLSKIWVSQLRYKWSAIRHKNSPKNLTIQQEQKYKYLTPRSIPQIKNIINEIHKRFQYTNDNWDRLYDSIDSPASCVIRAFENPPLRDDCDGFHSALYYFVSKNFDCRLLTVVTNDIKNSHTLLLLKYQQKYYYIDYTIISGSYHNIQNIIDTIKQKRYHNKNIIMYYELSLWENDRWISSNNF
jgi:hypothetical protein